MGELLRASGVDVGDPGMVWVRDWEPGFRCGGGGGEEWGAWDRHPFCLFFFQSPMNKKRHFKEGFLAVMASNARCPHKESINQCQDYALIGKEGIMTKFSRGERGQRGDRMPEICFGHRSPMTNKPQWEDAVKEKAHRVEESQGSGIKEMWAWILVVSNLCDLR